MKRPRGTLCFLSTHQWAWVVLSLSLAMTAWAWSIARDKESIDRKVRFQRQALRATADLKEQLLKCESMVKAARALLTASEQVTATEWDIYVQQIDLARHSPPVCGLGYVERVAARDVPAYLARVTAADPTFVAPIESPAMNFDDDARIMRYIQPVETNRAALGLDLRLRPDVLDTMDRATDTNIVAMTPVTRLAQDLDRPHDEPSVVVYLPVYQHGADVSSTTERREALLGWISAPLRLRVLASETMRRAAPGIAFELVHRAKDSVQAIGFGDKHGEGATHDTSDSPMRETADVMFGGQHWTLRFTALPTFVATPQSTLATLTLACGCSMSLLLFSIVLAFARTGAMADKLARAMTTTLRASESRLDAAITATQQLYYDWNTDDNSVMVRGCTRSFLGIEPGGITLEDWINLVHPDDRKAFQHEVDRVLRTREPFSLEYRMKRARGEYAIVQNSGCFLSDAAESTHRMVGFATDITARRRAEDERRQSDERFRVLFERAGVPFLLLVEGRVIDCNDAAVKILGAASKADVIGLRPHEFSPDLQPDGRLSSTWLAELFDNVETTTAASFEWTCRRRNGEHFIVEAVRASVTFGGARLVLVGWHDLTRVRRAEQERRRLQRVLQIAVDAMPQRVFWKDRAGTFLGCNKAFASDAGVACVDEIIGRTDFDLAWRVHAHQRRADDFEVMAAGRPRVNSEERTTIAGGAERWLRTTKIPLYDEAGRTIGILGTFEDITDERASKDELRRARDSAEAASRAKSDFLANMSHEIRTPMTAILGYADLLADPVQDAADRLGYVRTIRNNGEHLLAIINDILDLSKIEAGKMCIERVAVNPAALIHDAVALMKPRADSKGLRLETTFCARIPRLILSDPTRVRQMLVNLVGNAVKFTEEGEVRVHLEYEPGEHPVDARIRFDVTDSGIGMSDDVIARLFQPFTQADSSTTRRFGGTGLGLTVTRRLADILGGDVHVRSSPGKGSTFSIRIPVGASEAPDLVEPLHDAPSTVAPPSLASISLSGSVLLVEDGPDNQRLIAHILRTAGAQVEIAPNGQVALELIAAAGTAPTFHLILMDMQMPVMDGYSATRLLRTRGCRLPIIALTAHAMSGERERCVEAGCDDYATKPVARYALLSLCAQWIASARERNHAPPTPNAPVVGPAVHRS